MSDYDVEAVDRLPFTTAEKSARYRTENYQGAVGLNWYTTDPTLQATMAVKPCAKRVVDFACQPFPFRGRAGFARQPSAFGAAGRELGDHCGQLACVVASMS